jgi:hypothetical protein
MMETNSDESLRVLLRLLIDEIVEDVSRSGTGSKSRSVQKPNLPGAIVLGSPEGILQGHKSSRFQRADKTIETGK